MEHCASLADALRREMVHQLSAAHKRRKPVEVEYPDPGGASPAASDGEGDGA